MTPNGLSVKIKWSKTIQRAADLKTILLPETKDPLLCPVKAYRACPHTDLKPPAVSPLLVFEDGSPLTTRYIARRWTAALKSVGLSPTAYSLHSLRKGGACFAYNHRRANLNDVMAQGTWQSAAVRTYIKPHEAAPNSIRKVITRSVLYLFLS